MPNVTRLPVSPQTQARLVQERTQQALREAQVGLREIADFQAQFPPLNDQDTVPAIRWCEIERQLEALAANRQTRSLVRPLMADLRARAHWQPPEMLARGLILVTGLVMDETYEPGAMLEPEDDCGEVPMP